ncbi:MAG: formylglycine-generating enzyme family protein, partial [Planctomycetota bacterium]
EDAVGFAVKLNEWFAKRRSNSRSKKVLGWSELSFRLPTEAEWEYACRAGSQGDTYAGNLNLKTEDQTKAEMLDSIAWYGGNSGREYDLKIRREMSWLNGLEEQEMKGGTRKVTQKAPNPWGLYDMLGNVWEWCEDRYGKYLVERATDPIGPSEGMYRVSRGGSWDNRARYLRSACRYRNDPGKESSYLGFRLLSSAREIER